LAQHDLALLALSVRRAMRQKHGTPPSPLHCALRRGAGQRR
jgi:hypothetical protein